MLGTYSNCGISNLSNKTTSEEYFDDIHMVVIDGIRDNMGSLTCTRNHGAISTNYQTITDQYVMKYLFKILRLQYNTTTNDQVFKSGELFIRYELLSNIKDKTNWDWDTENQQQILIVSIRTILHPCSDVPLVTDVADTPRSVCNKKSTGSTTNMYNIYY